VLRMDVIRNLVGAQFHKGSLCNKILNHSGNAGDQKTDEDIIKVK